MSQFAFLKPEFAEVYEHAGRAESLALADPRAACFYARFALEVIVNWLYRHDSSLRNPYETTLSARIHEPTFRRLVGDKLVAKARIIKDLGNVAVHEARPVALVSAATALRELFHVSYWLVRTYARGAKPDPTLSFSPDALPRNAAISATSLKQLQEAARQLTEAVKAKDEAEAKRLASETERQKLEAEIAALRAEVTKAKAANAKVSDLHDYDEATTRDTFIDLLLFEAGWQLDQERDREFPVVGMPNESGDGFVDYVLWGDDGRPLAVVEAKRTKRDPRVGQQQAKLYADCLEARFGQRPVIFYTNGYDHWIWDDQRYPPRQIQGFLTKDELELAIRRRATLKPLAAADIDRTIVERFYQTRAIRRVGEAFEKDNLRRSLLVMATGAGKTRTVIALADLLMRANWARRILFLADRVALVNQAVGAFKRFLPSASPVNLVTEKTTQGRVYVSTYPTMMKLIDEAADGKRRFGPGHFDLIVIDEAHRSVYRKYGAIFDYFDSLLVGLTATPKGEVDHDTYGLFGLQRGVPTDAYGLDEAVKDGFLVPPKAVSVPLKFPREGIKYDDLPDEEKEAWDAIEWDEDGNVPARVEPAAVNKWLFNIDTADKALEHLMTFGLKVADGDRLGKTIIFAKSHDHAQFIVERFDANYPHLKGEFARVIDFKTEYAQSLIDDFSNPEKSPHIAVSVDMLDTGIDVPEVVNLVFFKIVRSKTKFWQMIGRGTRLRPDLFGPGRHKESFSIFDFCQNFEFFNQNPDLADGSTGSSLAKLLFTARVELIGEFDASADSAVELRSAIVKRLRDEVDGMSLENFLVRPKRRLIEKFAEDGAWTKLDLAARSELIDEIAGLPTSLTDDDIPAKQFDLLVLKTELAVMRSDKGYDGLRKKIADIASLLEEMANVPMVAAELALIHDLQTDEFWQDVTLPMLENVRTRLRGLIKLIELKKRPIVYTDFEDEIGQAAEIAVNGVSVGTDMDRFRLKARHFLKSNENHIAVLRLRRNEPLTKTDLAELERVFVEAGIAAADDVDRLKEQGGLGVFVRSIVGLDREAAKRAFDQFSAAHMLTANQLEFLNMVIDHLTERGIVEPELLYESPFTDLDPLGVAGVFSEGEVIELIGILNGVRDRAAA
ncbi:DEAD/DEAH box helicase family protein [Magnetospirillum sp. SS-4]|uniref:DEAD/DEAH box helicase family protein n=1 Tax=Magnetospirillum sp. SS-4 TaxID=2681465 RepID=UPI001381F48D|nr:DEAD/DEAH box helicase family protein [Magnetospirillum sp. SS-4]CAA7617427.1 Type I restriction-modification system, R subunit [Magnetospirillum sp. SS-4]